MNILGISGYYHDAAAAIVCGNKIVAAAQEERFSRIKHDASFPAQSIQYCLEYSGRRLNEIDGIVFYDKPFLKFERLLETYYNYAPSGFASFVKAMPVWLKEKIFLRKTLLDELKKIDEGFLPSKANILFTEHHLSHAASAFYASPFEESAILTIDGVGEWATASICAGTGNDIRIIKELHFPDSVGLLYSSFTYFLGFKVNSGEYKMMGLAPYGDRNSRQTQRFVQLIEQNLAGIDKNGSIRLNKKYFNYAKGLTMVDGQLWEKLFGVPLRKPEGAINQAHCNLALAIQQVTEEIVLRMARHAKEITGIENLCFAGGVALNSVANGKLQCARIFKNIFIQPAAGDAGGAVGAALAANHITYKQPRTTSGDTMQNASLGPEFSTLEIERVARKYKAVFHRAENETIVRYLNEGKIIGWFKGRMEFGPRALGYRSILASPLFPEMQKKINLNIKFRENFRPFAALTTEEDAATYFAFEGYSPYMLLVHKVREQFRHPLPDGYEEFTMEEKLSTVKSRFPAITHVDYSCRIQTVNQYSNPQMWQLLNDVKAKTGYALLVNTSFNVRGEPMVCTPAEAYAGFMRTGMDVLVMNDYIFLKEEQPDWKEDPSAAKYLLND